MIPLPQRRLAVEGRFSSSRELGPRSDFVCWSCVIKVERRRLARRSRTRDWKTYLVLPLFFNASSRPVCEI